MSAGTFYKEHKSTINIVVGVAAVGVGFAFWKAQQRKKELADAFQQRDAINNEIVELANQGVTPSFTESAYYSMADGLVQSMEGCGTDEDQLMSIFGSLQNGADLRKLILAFGVRFYTPCFWQSPIQSTVHFFDEEAYGGDLTAWLYYDLSDSNLKDLNALLHKNGIDYTL